MDGRGTMQSVILALQHFWAERGCLIWQPYYTQVGAGTMNPATFLRVLGPEPWRVAYVEPSIRPDDARYGENPNRLQQHYQFQVILKPDPGNPQEIYLQSLLAIGVDPARHDIRFVEDKWEAPALGAWGLGWEVWLDGQEITQFTYFQQAGGELLDPVSVEITYGLERILIGILSLDHFKDIPWNDRLCYGDLLLQAEAEQSRYYLEQADINHMNSLFAIHEDEARAALEHGLVLPAYDNLLRCSHLFNVLDARGAVGVTERAALFGRMRELSRTISEKYIDQRRQLEFPWIEAAAPAAASSGAFDEPGRAPAGPEDFVLEVGTEELPAGEVALALAALEQRAPALLDDHHLTHRGIRVSGTPRRLVVEIAGLAPTQGEVVEVVKGPPEARAFDAAGWPTQAALGWARKQGQPSAPEELRSMVRDLEGGRYLAAEVRRGGEAASSVLARHILPRLIDGIGFEQTMRWIGAPGDSPEAAALRRTTFSRPIRWLVALHGEQVVPFQFAGLQAGRTTRSLRFGEPETVSIGHATEYPSRLAALGITIDPAERRRLILEQARSLAAAAGGQVEADDGLLAEVAQLVEAPQALLGDFDPAFLSLPPEVLVAVMRKHQRYFPVRDAHGALLPHFIVVRNGGDQGLDSIRAGNQHVLRARFADAEFFLRKDRQHPLEFYRDLLARLTFEARLGSMLDKADRIEPLTLHIAGDLHLTHDETRAANRAAHLCKADLATAMVSEMTSLQGVLGRTYARESDEPEVVAQAIFEHLLPRFAGDALPESAAGITVGLADRIDTLCGLFAAGLQPTGTRDPFALRRTAVGLVQILVARGVRVALGGWLDHAAARLPIALRAEARQACLEFIVARQEALLLAEGHRYDVVAAVLAVQGTDPAGAASAVAELEAAVGEAGWPSLLQAYARCARIARGQKVDGRLDPAIFKMDAERGLLAALDRVDPAPGSIGALVQSLRSLVPPITEFFDKVLVMDEDKAVRANRLALVQRVVALADGIADLSKLEGF
ncbi:MAG: glyQS [Anaerolineales bacterium]|nr:glyQS [Anaerolineales bacterium]